MKRAEVLKEVDEMVRKGCAYTDEQGEKWYGEEAVRKMQERGGLYTPDPITKGVQTIGYGIIDLFCKVLGDK